MNIYIAAINSEDGTLRFESMDGNITLSNLAWELNKTRSLVEMATLASILSAPFSVTNTINDNNDYEVLLATTPFSKRSKIEDIINIDYDINTKKTLKILKKTKKLLAKEDSDNIETAKTICVAAILACLSKDPSTKNLWKRVKPIVITLVEALSDEVYDNKKIILG